MEKPENESKVAFTVMQRTLEMKLKEYESVCSWFEKEYDSSSNSDTVREWEDKAKELNAQINILRYLITETKHGTKSETDKFEKYKVYVKKDGAIIGVRSRAFKLADEAFQLFKELFDTNYGHIYENDNLISIHTGGWSENEALIAEFEETAWWHKYHKITASGGHYYFNTDVNGGKAWKIVGE